MDFFKNLASETLQSPKGVFEEITQQAIDFGAAAVSKTIPFVPNTTSPQSTADAANQTPTMSSALPTVPPSKAGQPALIAKYDMVLGIAIDAINAQFKTLYNTELPGQDQNLDPKDREHLINWRFTMSEKTTSTSIKGYIYPPYIDITNLSVSADKHRTVRMNFKFMPGVGSSINSYTFEESPNFDKDGTYVRKDHPTTHLDNWTFSFEASIGSAEIRKVMRGTVHPKIAEALESYVQNEEFTAASLFCLFQSKQIANTFTLKDPNGKEPDDESVSKKFMLAITAHFASFNKQPEVAGSNPWVLGYPIHQRPNRPMGQAEWAPKNFYMSTTAEGRSQFNYLLAVDGNEVEPAKDGTAGILNKSFFTIVGSNNHDGILAMSSDLVQKKFITEIVKPHFVRQPLFNSETVTIKDETLTGDDLKQKVSWETPFISQETIIKQRCNFKGSYDLNIRRWSNNTANPDSVRGQDAHRIMFIDVDIAYTVNMSYDVAALGFDEWSTQMTASTTVPIKVRYSVVPGEKGVWTATQDSQYTQLPLVRDGKLVYHTGEKGEGVRVNIDYKSILEFTDFFGFNDFIGITDAIGTAIGSIANAQNLKLESNVLTGLRNKILMPAGDVFTFSGLDTDAEGNTYSHVDYNTISDGDVDATK